MLRHLSAAAFLVALAAPLGAEPVAATCPALIAAVDGFDGYKLTVPPAGPEDGWCVLDGAALRAEALGRPDLTVDRLRLRGMVDGADLVAIEVDLAGLRAAYKANDDSVDDRARGLVRLQSADLRFGANVDAATGQVTLSGGVLRLSSGTEVAFSAAAQAGGLSGPALLAGRLTSLNLDWKNDARLLRPVMEMLGERLVEGASPGAAVDATRQALRQVVESLPAAALGEDSGPELEQWIAALPQGRGRLTLALVSADGIGAGQVLMAGLQTDGLGPQALAKLLSGAEITATWTPGIAP
jgi:hypothetical protein